MTPDDIASRQRIFRGHVRRALLHLYNPASLRRSPLLELLGIATSADKVFATRDLIHKSIQALKPDRSSKSRPVARQIYQILNYRYLEQMPQKEVVSELAISLRQLQRLEALALETLSTHLLEAYSVRLEDLKIENMQEDDLSISDSTVQEENEPETQGAILENSPLLQELEWVKQSGTLDTVGVRAFLDQILATISPLFTSLGIKYETILPPDDIQITGNLMALRQGFINILTAMAGAFHSCEMHIHASTQDGHVTVRIDQTGGGEIAPHPVREERIRLADELFQITGSQMETAFNNQARVVTVSIPVHKHRVVMAIEDNLDALALINAYLSEMGCQFHSTRDPLQVQKLVETVEPDVILLDVMLPGIDGWQILGRLKHNPQTAQIPVVINTILPQAELAYSLGADAFLRKPFTQSELVTVISQLFERGPESR
jgi:CheY-like chemotaxis protein